VKYAGVLEVQIFDRATGLYVPYPFCPPDQGVARAIAGGAPWRIAKSDRPLKPAMKDHYYQYAYDGDYQGKS
jgi:hypothetical protein